MATIALSGSIAQRPGRAGHTWVFLSYLLGFRSLGYEVLFIDRLTLDMVDRADRDGRGPDWVRSSPQARWMVEMMRDAGLGGSYALLLEDGVETIGLSRRETLERLARSSVLINFNGFLTDEELLQAAPMRVYLDIDPGFAQMWEATGLATPFDGHDAFVTVGANVGEDWCAVPSNDRRWVATVQPILLDRWPAVSGGEGFTSIGSWRGPFAPVSHQAHTYGLRVHEFRRFASLPERLIDTSFEIALDVDPEDGGDVELLKENSWSLADPGEVAGDLLSYRNYIQGSMAEIAIAKSMYVETKGGWFSDRSACYLASGKPVLAQDTGFGTLLPTGEGLLGFSDLDQAVFGAEQIFADLDRHAAAARSIAEEFFDAGKVLTVLLDRLGVG